jgi:hypothetical protein
MHSWPISNRLRRRSCFHLVASLAEIEALPGVTKTHLWEAFLVEKRILDDLFKSAVQTPTHPALYITKGLVNPCPSGARGQSREEGTVLYIRAVLSWSILLSRDRAWANEHTWFLAHSLLVQELLDDDAALQAPSLLPQLEQAALQAISHRLSSYLVLQGSTKCDSLWHEATISTCKDASQQTSDQLSAIFVDTVHHLKAVNPSASLAGRVFTELMALLVRYSDMQMKDAERWLAFARSIRSTSKCKAELFCISEIVRRSRWLFSRSMGY